MLALASFRFYTSQGLLEDDLFPSKTLHIAISPPLRVRLTEITQYPHTFPHFPTTHCSWVPPAPGISGRTSELPVSAVEHGARVYSALYLPGL